MELVYLWVFQKNFTKGLKKGDSIAVNGVCLTVKRFNPEKVFLM